METDNLYKEFEPDANEIMFGQTTLPDRPLTMREASKRKKIIMKLVDQKLKFKLIELMGQQVAAKENTEQNTPETSATTLPTVSPTNNHSQPSGSYPSQSTWTNSSGWELGETNWQQPFHAEWQSSIYPPHHDTIVDESWNNNCSFQPNIQSNVRANLPYFHRNLDSKKSLKRKCTENLNLVRPMIDANKMTSLEMRDEQMNSATCSSLISITCKQNPPNQSKVIQPPTYNQLSAAPALNVANPHLPKRDQILAQSVPLSANSTATEKYTTNLSMPRRRRRYGRGGRKQIKASANEVGNVVLGDKFGLRCVAKVTSEVANDANSLWNEIDRLVTTVFRKGVNRIEPLSSFEQKLHNRIAIEMSTNPDVLRSDKYLSQFLNRAKIEEMISKGKMILQRVKQSNSQFQNDFAQFRDKRIKDAKALNDETETANETENEELIHTKISAAVDSLFSMDVDKVERNKLISQLVHNPHALGTCELITKPIPNETKVLCEIKRILDEHMIVRPAKRFYIPIHRIIDVPFVVTVHERSGSMTEEKLKILLDALVAKVESVIMISKPRIVDPKFCAGTLVMVCANRKTFDLIKTTISDDFNGKWTGADLAVTPAQVKNPLPRSELKPVLMKFSEPQFYHFNDLMAQLKIDNPSLLARRWELREAPAGKFIDSTEGIYVGVDMESLGPIEQMNRVAVLLKSTVMFEICYDDSERNYLPDHTLLTQ